MFYNLKEEETTPKKRRLKKGTLYLIFSLLFIILLLILDLFNIIYIYDNSIIFNNNEVLKFIILYLIFKGIKTIIKEINKREV